LEGGSDDRTSESLRASSEFISALQRPARLLEVPTP
jgi:hypothetical protein